MKPTRKEMLADIKDVKDSLHNLEEQIHAMLLEDANFNDPDLKHLIFCELQKYDDLYNLYKQL